MKEILITSSVLILALLVLRRVFRGVLSRRVQYALWALVLLRLLAPVSLPAVDFSVLTASQPVQQAVSSRFEAIEPMYLPVDRAPIRQHPTAPNLTPAQAMAPTESNVWVMETEDTAVQYRRVSTGQILSLTWKAGMIAVGAFFLVCNLRFYFRLKKRRREWQAEGGMGHVTRKVYMVEDGILPSPCLFGNSIYLTPAAAADPDKLRHVLAHEETHARHLDPLWSLLRCVCLTVYWFDPLVWVAAWCAKTDCELACDEGALARLGEAERISYGQTLLSLIPVKKSPSNPLLAATTMTAGKKQLKDRITRIAHKPRQLMAAVLAVAVLAAIMAACTFTGANTPAEPAAPTQSPKPVESQAPTGPVALTGTELRWFNENFFNSSATDQIHLHAASGDGNETYYNIRNQFANPGIPYDKPEDIPLYDLFYLEGSAPSDEELRSILDTDPDDLPCPAYKLTTAEMDEILKANTGLTTAGTAKKGLDSFRYDETADAYFWMHGDTNYCGDLDFLCGTRDGSVVKLYHNSHYSGSDWYCVTLSEQGEGKYWFVSNQTCEHPVIPTVMPSSQPEATISLKDLEPYAPEAVTVEAHPNHYFFNYETCYANWDIDGHHIMVYRAEDGVVYAAYEEDDVYYVFLSGLSEERNCVSFYNDLLGRDGFYVDYSGPYNERSSGPIRDYYYFNGDGALALLARCRTYGGAAPYPLDLDGDGRDELVSARQMFFERDGLIYEAKLDELLLAQCPELSYWDGESWDPYARRLYANGLRNWDDESGGAQWERYLYFDGETILAYKGSKSVTDHVVDGIAAGVPTKVVEQAKAQLASLLQDHGDGTYRFAGNDEYDLPMDDWRLHYLSGPTAFTLGNVVIEVWSYGGQVHTADPKKFVWAGGSYMDEDGWCSIDHSDFYGDLVYQVEGARKFLFASSYQDGGLESVDCRGRFYRDLEEHGVDISPASYAALEAALHIESLSYGDALTIQPVGGSERTVPLDEEGKRVLAGLTDPEEVKWTRAEAPTQEPVGDSVILRHSDWYDMLQFWADTDLVKYKNTNDPEAVWYRAESLRDGSGALFDGSRPYDRVRGLYDEAQ